MGVSSHSAPDLQNLPMPPVSATLFYFDLTDSCCPSPSLSPSLPLLSVLQNIFPVDIPVIYVIVGDVMCDVMCDAAMLDADDDVHGTVYPQWIDWLDVD